MQLQCGIDEYCLNNDPVQYQCTVTDSNILQWRIRDENTISLGTVLYGTLSDLVTTPSPFPNNLPAFYTDYTSKSPSLISNISFTVRSSYSTVPSAVREIQHEGAWSRMSYSTRRSRVLYGFRDRALECCISRTARGTVL